MRHGIYVLAALGLAALTARADEEIDELRRRNEQLEQRVRRLETTALDADIDGYLEHTYHESLEGPPGLHPGALAIRISGEIRIRQEFKDRIYSPTDPAGMASFEFAHMRSRLRFDVDVLENLGVVIELQDIREFGEEGSTTFDLEGVDLKRGFITFRQVGGQPLDVDAGRFVLQYGDQRVIGNLEWFDQGRSYDGLRAHYAPEGWWVDAFAVRVRETITPDDDQWFTGVYGGRDWLEAYAILFADDMQMAGELGSLDDTMFVTLGLRVARKTGGWDYSLEVALQTGDVKGDDLTAFAFALVVGHTFEDAAWTPRVFVEVAFATGDSNSADGDTEQFQVLFPTNHGHYGHADVVAWSNILDLKVGVQLKPTGYFTIKIDYHHFRRPEEQGAWINAGGGVIRPGLPGSSEHLGDEIDLVLVWKPNQPLSLEAGYAVFFPGGFVRDTGDDPTAHFFYLQTRVKF